MKKLIVASAVTIAALVSTADFVRFTQVVNGKTVTNDVDCVSWAKANAGQPKDSWTDLRYSKFLEAAVTPSVRAEMDDILSSKKFYVSTRESASSFPKLWANYTKIYVGTAKEAVVPVIEAVVRSPNAYDVSARIQAIALYVDLVDSHFVSPNRRNSLLGCVPGAVKFYLRKNGKSFVTKDGVNPIQELLTPVVNAINAPRMAGLNDALRAFGMDYGLDFEAHLLPDSDIRAIKDDVLYGAKSFEGNKSLLRTHLGVEGYNAFVREYNGED